METLDESKENTEPIQNTDTNDIPAPKKFALPPPVNLPINARIRPENSYKITVPEQYRITGDKIYNSDLSSQDKSVLYRNHLDSGLEIILEMLINAQPFREIIYSFGVPMGVFFRWRMQGEHSAECEDAMKYASFIMAEKAEEVLSNPAGQYDMAEVNRCRELSQYYRWRSAMANPSVFGTKKVDTNITITDKADDKDEFKDLVALAKERNRLRKEQQAKDTQQRNDHVEDAQVVE